MFPNFVQVISSTVKPARKLVLNAEIHDYCHFAINEFTQLVELDLSFVDIVDVQYWPRMLLLKKIHLREPVEVTSDILQCILENTPNVKDANLPCKINLAQLKSIGTYWPLLKTLDTDIDDTLTRLSMYSAMQGRFNHIQELDFPEFDELYAEQCQGSQRVQNLLSADVMLTEHSRLFALIFCLFRALKTLRRFNTVTYAQFCVAEYSLRYFR